MTGNESSRAEYLIGQLNVTNAKKVAVLMVLGFICYHGLIHLRYGLCICSELPNIRMANSANFCVFK